MAKQTLTVQLMHAHARIAELEVANAALVETLASYQARVAQLEAPRAQQPSAKPQPTEFTSYWDYVRAAKKWCHANNKPVAYASRETHALTQEQSA